MQRTRKINHKKYWATKFNFSFDLRDLRVLHLGRGSVASGRRDRAGHRLEVVRLGGLDQVLLGQQLLQVMLVLELGRRRLQGRRGELRGRRQQRGRVGAPRAAVHLARPTSATAATCIRTANGDR